MIAVADPRAATGPGRSGRGGPWFVRDLVVRYGTHTAIEGVSFQVPAGELTAVIGADGAGKSTLLRALAGTIRLAAGTVNRPDRRRLGYVAGDRAVYRDLTVRENLVFAGGAYGLRAGALEARIAALLAGTGLGGAETRLGGQLSGGMRQKLALAMATLHEPDLLILDEPTTGVDPLSRVELWQLIAEVAARGTAVAFATTYIDEAERAGGVLVLAEGRTLAEGTPESVVAAMEGSIWESAGQLDAVRSWRHGATWRTWLPAGLPAPANCSRIEPDLEDALVVAELARIGAPEVGR